MSEEKGPHNTELVELSTMVTAAQEEFDMAVSEIAVVIAASASAVTALTAFIREVRELFRHPKPKDEKSLKFCIGLTEGLYWLRSLPSVVNHRLCLIVQPSRRKMLIEVGRGTVAPMH